MKVARQSVLKMLKKLFWAVCLFFGAYIGFENAVYAEACFLPDAQNGAKCGEGIQGVPGGGRGTNPSNPELQSDPSNPGNSCAGYNDTAKASECFSCTPCPSDGTRYSCTERSVPVKGWVLNGNACVQDPCNESYNSDTALDEHCYDCEKCSYSYSARYNKYKCDAKTNMGDYEIYEGTCQLIPGSNCSGALETDIVRDYGQNWRNCYEDSSCKDSDGRVRYSLLPKETIESEFYISESDGKTCKQEECLTGDGYAHETEEACLGVIATNYEASTNGCYDCKKCSETDSPRKGYYKIEAKSAETLILAKRFIDGNGVCVVDACDVSVYPYMNEAECVSGENGGNAYWVNCHTCEKCASADSYYTDYYKPVLKETPDEGYFLAGELCQREECPASEYAYADESACKAAAATLHTSYWDHCYRCEKCNSSSTQNANNYRIVAKTDIENPWSINSEGQCTPCEGKYLCGTRQPGGDSCTVEGIDETFYEHCYLVETCFATNKVTDQGTCYYSSNSQDESKYPDLGYYKSYECTTITGQKFIYHNNLSQTDNDCQGNVSPLVGKVPCEAEEGQCLEYMYDGYYWCDTCSEAHQPTCYYDASNGRAYLEYQGLRFDVSGVSVYRRNSNRECPADKSCFGYRCVFSKYNPISSTYDTASYTCTSKSGQEYYLSHQCQGSSAPSTKLYMDCLNEELPVPNGWIRCPAGERSTVQDNEHEILCGDYYYAKDECTSSGSGSGGESGNQCTTTCNTTKEKYITGETEDGTTVELNACIVTSYDNYRYERKEEKCSDNCDNNKKYYYATDCYIDGYGCDGQKTPKKLSYDYRKKFSSIGTLCPDGYFLKGGHVTCGGIEYYESCAYECNYQETPESCEEKGKEFVLKCYQSETVQYGECK